MLARATKRSARLAWGALEGIACAVVLLRKRRQACRAPRTATPQKTKGGQQQQQKAGTPKKKLKGNCKGFTFPKKPCTQCGKMVASSYMQRHLKRCTESNRPGPSRANLKPRTMHVVDKIDAHRVGPDGKIEYKVRWQGYSPNDDTWEKKVNMDCEELITAYEEYGICYRIYNF